MRWKGGGWFEARRYSRMFCGFKRPAFILNQESCQDAAVVPLQRGTVASGESAEYITPAWNIARHPVATLWDISKKLMSMDNG